MRKLEWVLSGKLCLLMFFLSACGSDGDQNRFQKQRESSDEAHRPGAWQAEMTYTIEFAAADAYGFEAHQILEEKILPHTAFHGLASQLFDLAMSGDVKVYEPTVLGEPDYDAALNPGELVKFLDRTDSVLTRDLETGEMVMTAVVDQFGKSRVNAIVLLDYWDPETLEMHIPMVMIGEQAFDDDGFYRGIRPVFFMELSGVKSPDGQHLDFNLVTDSIGAGHLHELVITSEEPDAGKRFAMQFKSNLDAGAFGKEAMLAQPDTVRLQMHQNWIFSFADRRFYIENLNAQLLLGEGRQVGLVLQNAPTAYTEEGIGG